MDRNRLGSIPRSLIAYAVVCSSVVVIVVSLRLYVRLRLLRKPGIDDIALAVTLFSTIASVIVTTYATGLGLGRHFDTLSMEQRVAFSKFIFVSTLGYHFCIILLKSTFLLQFRRVFPLPTFERLCNIFLAFLGVWAIAGLVGAVTICLPISRNWDPRESISTCNQRFWYWLGYGIVHLITDLLIFIMPLPMLRMLPLPPLHKVVLMGVFGLGFLTCIISALRLTTLHASLRDPDASWTAATTVYWTFGEVTCSIVCLCIPTLRPLLGTCCCSRRRSGEGNIMERGAGRFGFYALDNLSSPSSSALRTETHPPIGNLDHSNTKI
ncbi:hypothetical protein C8A00DRAFT_11824 [Chaetomidium leptoderma]|uniref:Rhodopsin domain-containing protein n=1 Tax=Chaetomidium leptoderma TaxID=669021 RepID=A0AAN6VT37_9PEZI|nr:hypothetical protein C8A00DRAFT_11824 [Chaetomidium leptoderma]